MQPIDVLAEEVNARIALEQWCVPNAALLRHARAYAHDSAPSLVPRPQVFRLYRRLLIHYDADQWSYHRGYVLCLDVHVTAHTHMHHHAHQRHYRRGPGVYSCQSSVHSCLHGPVEIPDPSRPLGRWVV